MTRYMISIVVNLLKALTIIAPLLQQIFLIVEMIHTNFQPKTITTSETLSRLFLFFCFFSHNFVFTSGVFFVVSSTSSVLYESTGALSSQIVQSYLFFLILFVPRLVVPSYFLLALCAQQQVTTTSWKVGLAWRLACAMPHSLTEQRGKFQPINKVLLIMKLNYIVLLVIELWNIIKKEFW